MFGLFLKYLIYAVPMLDLPVKYKDSCTKDDIVKPLV